MQSNAIRYHNGVRFMKLLAAMAMLLTSGCIGDRFTTGLQDVAVIVREHSTTKYVAGALVTADFPAEEGLTKFIREMLEYSRAANLDTAPTDELGQATVPVSISGFPSSLGPDQITGGPTAFRVEVKNAGEYLFDGSLRPGHVLTGSRFDVEIRSIGQPYYRKDR